jgi:lipopolysaccharide export LptBFGC system permease protein LptF
LKRRLWKQPKTTAKKPLDVAALVLALVTIAAAPFIPLVSYACGIVGLVFAIRHRKSKRTTVALVLCIVGLVGAVVSNIYSAIHISQALGTWLN